VEPSEPKKPLSARTALVEVCVVTAVVTALLSALYHVGLAVPWVAKNLAGAAAVFFVYAGTWRIWRTGSELSDYGVTYKPVGPNLLWGIGSAVVVLGVFLAGYIWYYNRACAPGGGLFGPLGRNCAFWVGELGNLTWRWPKGFAELLLAEFVVVAIPEEVFFRGYVQGHLNRVFTSRIRLFRVELGWAVLIQAGLFGLGHFLVDFNPLRLAVAIPALAFGFLREASGSVTAPVLFHALSNSFMAAVDHNFFYAGK
jgi:membrane protease YdiL (CAAX protease family)